MSSSFGDISVPPRFGMFDCVSVTESFSTTDEQGESLSLGKGRKGFILYPGEKKNSYVIEFRIGAGIKGTDFTAVELPDELLHLENPMGKRFEPADWDRPRCWF
jgi:hypothetical protein